MITGIAASPGIAIGTALKIEEHELNIEKKAITDIDFEINSLKEAIKSSRVEISKIKYITEEKLGHESAMIFDAHLMILDDPEVYLQTVQAIEKDLVNASWALKATTDNFIAIFSALDDDYMKERASDIKDVFTRVLKHLEGIESIDLSLIEKDVILVANDLTPSQTATMNKSAVLGFLTTIGGKTSHSAIMARTLEVPAVVGVEGITDKVNNDDVIIFDGNTGQVMINPSDELMLEYRKKQEEELVMKQELRTLLHVEPETEDGHKIELAGNIGTVQDIDSLHNNGATSVGLYRTEFLFMDRASMPNEQEQYDAYSNVFKKLEGKECVIRTLDIGGDKNLPYLKIDKEENPFLGHRAIRICLDNKDLFKTQLKAILRASIHGNVSIMFPMISSYEELMEAKSVLEEAKLELRNNNIEYSHSVKVGIMIEVPSAALMADILAKEVDFFSLGTNDLTQYTCAVDRINPKVEHLYDPFNPGLLRLIRNVAIAAKDNNISISICGSMAHIPELLPFFISCGIDKLSMSPIHVLGTKKLIRSLNAKKSQQLTDKLLGLPSAKEIKELLKYSLEELND